MERMRHACGAADRPKRTPIPTFFSLPRDFFSWEILKRAGNVFLLYDYGRLRKEYARLTYNAAFAFFSLFYIW